MYIYIINMAHIDLELYFETLVDKIIFLRLSPFSLSNLWGLFSNLKAPIFPLVKKKLKHLKN